MYRRKLQLKANLESGPSYISFKSLDQGAFNPGFIGCTCTALPQWGSQPHPEPGPRRIMHSAGVLGFRVLGFG
jgi:hypothetical protein